jgi:CheY-like chemotaxis protein
MLLERRGFSVKVAGTVGAALAAAKSTPFDVLVSDIELPDGKGHDLVRKLRAEDRPEGDPPGPARIPAIALSGLDSEADVKSGRDAGFDEYLGKPVSVDDLVDALRRVAAT